MLLKYGVPSGVRVCVTGAASEKATSVLRAQHAATAPAAREHARGRDRKVRGSDAGYRLGSDSLGQREREKSMAYPATSECSGQD